MSTAFHSGSLKRESTSVAYEDSIQTTLETEEAGSILISLSQHKPKMSISSLLDKNNSDHHEYVQKPPIHLNKNRQIQQPYKPRIRRCALQAYISYKTYLDLTRKKKNQKQELAPLRNRRVNEISIDISAIGLCIDSQDTR
ncbi:hypothetical protein K501DRAFT_337322 [Backusella circina FSU 941]|nr:hypothetical protein K501DRAFT_337322 [Backusella circina FSU 941]